jgi:hypothetical protein
MLKKEPLSKKNFIQNNRNRVSIKVIKAYIGPRSSVEVARMLPR